ncbi:MAG TPA: DUF3237 family protein [Variovorax sp.]|nr:DUF3237 family protein [Variovorax sp.]
MPSSAAQDTPCNPAALHSEFAFRVRLEFGSRLRFGPLPTGGRCGYVAVIGGTVTGPRLQGKVVPHSGGDWPHLWPDGTIEFDARYLIEADDGTLIYVQNRGVAHASAAVQARIDAGEPIDPRDNYFRTTPVFKVAVGPHDWLSRTVFVGLGDKRADHSLFEFHAVR